MPDAATQAPGPCLRRRHSSSSRRHLSDDGGIAQDTTSTLLALDCTSSRRDRNDVVATALSESPCSTQPVYSTPQSLYELLQDVRDRKRRRLSGSISPTVSKLPLDGRTFERFSLEEYPEFQCSICLDVLTHPISLKACKHHFCRLCMLETILTGLQVHGYTPSCPLCRSSICFLSDLQKQRELAERIYGLFPAEVMQKVNTTHTLERQKVVAASIKELAEKILSEQAEAAQQGGSQQARHRMLHNDDELAAAVAAALPEGLLADDSTSASDEDFLLLTIELVCLSYALVVFALLLWLRCSHYFVI